MNKHLAFAFIVAFSCIPSVVSAQTYDSSTVEMYQTVAFEKEEENYNIEDLVLESPLRRYPDIGTKMEGVPGTKFNLVFLYYNFGIEDLLVEKVFFPMSREVSDLSNLVKSSNPVSIQNLHTKWGNVDLYREGKGIEYPLDEEILSMEMGRIVLDEFEIGDSLVIESVELTPDLNNSQIYFTVNVRNLTYELLNNVVYIHQDYTYTQNILPNSQVVYEYTLPLFDPEVERYSFGNIEIQDPNTKTECSAEGNRWYQYYYTKAISVYSYVANSWISGLYVQPERESFCVTRLPHDICSEEIFYQKEEVVDNHVEKVSDDESGESVLGVEIASFSNMRILPKTSRRYLTFLILLLVADIYLWYSVFNKRGKYESKNNNTRICSGSSK